LNARTGGGSVKNAKSFIMDVADIYFGKRVTRGAAALSYYLTMTLFPLLICLYSMLGTRYQQAMQALSVVRSLIAEETFSAVEDFLTYVASNNSTAMLIAALMVLFTSASAAFRSFETTIGEIQGEIRFRGFWGLMASLLFSLVFLAAVYMSILILMTGSWFLELVSRILPFVNISRSWTWVRFIVLFGIVFVLIYSLYHVTAPAGRRYGVVKGALAATVALVAVSIIFSMFIGVSAKYPLVYGSLASVILLMFWLYLSSLMLIMGDVINVVIRNRGRRAAFEEAREEDEAADD